jgi:hypothetical protein
MDETRWNNLVSTVGNFDMIAVAAGVGASEWDGPACKAAVIDVARRATTPYCDSGCSPLGFCDSDCRDVADLCGRMVSYDVLQGVMTGGGYEMVMKGMIGDLAPCLNDILVYITGDGDASKICDSSFSSFAHMSFGSAPNTDCLPLSTDPNSFLRDPSSSPSSGSCALSKYDVYEAEKADVIARNEALLSEARNATPPVVEPVLVETKSYPWWRGVAIPTIPLLMFALLWVGDRLSVKKKEAGAENLAAVTPVSPPRARSCCRRRCRCSSAAEAGKRREGRRGREREDHKVSLLLPLLQCGRSGQGTRGQEGARARRSQGIATAAAALLRKKWASERASGDANPNERARPHLARPHLSSAALGSAAPEIGRT